MVANQIMMINNPGNEKMVEKASEELSLSMLSSIKSETDLLSILHNLFGAIKGKMVISIAYIHNAKERGFTGFDWQRIADYLPALFFVSLLYYFFVSGSCH